MPKALITGDAGFVGTHFKKFLKELGWEVYGLDIKTYSDEDCVRYSLANHDEWFDLVVHLAYEVGGRAHIDGVNMALAHNLAIDSTVIDWASRSMQGALLYFSSSAAYPIAAQTVHNHQRLDEDLIDLDYPSPPDANYGWAKLTGEKVAQAAKDNGLPVYVVRPFSGYAEDQSLDYPFPSIVQRALAGDNTVWGPRGQTRDWIHIEDVVAGAFEVYQQGAQHPVNLCTGVPTEMGELYNLVRTVAELDTQEIQYLTDKPTGVFYRVGDPYRLHNYYVPKISLEEGIQRALEVNG